MSWFSSKSKPAAHCEAPASGDAILVDHITKKYGEFTAVDDVTFSVHPGEIFGLLGPNGAGKSTLIRMMTTLLPITSGRALINGFDVSRQADAARQCIGVIPQAQHRRAAGDGGPVEMAQCADQNAFGRHETAPGNRARIGTQPQNFLPRRADYRSRSRLARRRVGDADSDQEPSRANHSDYHPLHGR